MKKIVPVLAGTLILGACGASTPARDSDATRTVKHALGEAEIPADPQRILAVDEYAAMNLLSVGVEPDLVYQTFQADVSPEVFEHLGIETREEPTFLSAPDFEQVLQDAPDLVVMSAAGPLAAQIEEFEKLAPTVALSFDEGWRASLEQTAEIFEAQESAEQVEAALTQRLEALSTSWGGETELSILLAYQGMSFHPTPGAPMSQLVEEVGLGRVEAQLATAGERPGEFIAPIDEEQLDGHDADWIAVLANGSYEAETLRDNPLFDGLVAAQAGRTFDVDGEMWFGSSVFTMWWILDDLEAVILDGLEPGTATDAVQRWEEYATASLA